MVDLRHGSRTAAKRLDAGGPSPGGGPSPQPGRKAFGLRSDGGGLARELGKPCGCGQINHFLRLKINAQGICHAQFSISGQVWQVSGHGFDLKDPICFPFSNSEHVSATNQENHYVPPLAIFSDSKPYLFAVYHTSPGVAAKLTCRSKASCQDFQLISV